ncbi:hypothetical protein SAMN05443575_3351 [Jatrophihabitans endophyticus]|uniref:Uncharacterized protein n=1 Tax=Jatrophihabitans endophyticus TaxID=1206085 RepID=A0A1M5QAS6_9ACTN|nr:hypothetical protein [Jatrophihabitans endophyticus]SHH11142.1 hypothetical protein SAMN05443575_3351 [Jatrophihabitans endophyticus]
MTTALDDPAPATGGRPARRTRRWWYVGAAAVLAVTAVVVTLVVALRDDDLHVFGDGGGGGTGVNRFLPGRTIFFNTELGLDEVDEPIVLDAVEPVTAFDSARSTLRIVVCEPRGEFSTLGAGYSADVRAECRTVTALVPGRTEIDARSAIMLAMTPRREGVTTVEGFRVRYHRGDRSGDERAGAHIELRTRGVPSLPGD